MKKLFYLLLIGSTLAMASCDDDQVLGGTAEVNMNFKATYLGEPLIMLQDQYKYPDGRQIMFQTLNFFLSEIVLLEEEGGGEVELIEVAFVDFSDNTTEVEANSPVTMNVPRVPAGTYKGIKIGFGVPADLNSQSANQFGSEHPLRKNFGSHFWSDWNSFIFMKSEGVYDENGDGINGTGDVGFGHHTGTDAIYRTVTISETIVVEEGQVLDLNFVFDVLDMYQNGSELLDLTDPANRYTHNPTDLGVATYLVDNYDNALSID